VEEIASGAKDNRTIPSKQRKPHTHWLRFGRYRGAGHRF